MIQHLPCSPQYSTNDGAVLAVREGTPFSCSRLMWFLCENFLIYSICSLGWDPPPKVIRLLLTTRYWCSLLGWFGNSTHSASKWGQDERPLSTGWWWWEYFLSIDDEDDSVWVRSRSLARRNWGLGLRFYFPPKLGARLAENFKGDLHRSVAISRDKWCACVHFGLGRWMIEPRNGSVGKKWQTNVFYLKDFIGEGLWTVGLSNFTV